MMPALTGRASCSIAPVNTTTTTHPQKALFDAGIKAPRGLHKRARMSLAASAAATPDSALIAGATATRSLPAQGSAPLPARPGGPGAGLGGTPAGDPGVEFRSQSLPAALHAAARPNPTPAGATCFLYLGALNAVRHNAGAAMSCMLGRSMRKAGNKTT